MGVGRMASFCTCHKQFEREKISEKDFFSPKELQWKKEMSFTWKINEKKAYENKIIIINTHVTKMKV
jgi:hypothetical protein